MSKRKLELIDALRAFDTALAEARSALDSACRGRRFKDAAEAATKAAKVATLALGQQAELDKILTEEWEKRRKG